MFGAIFLSLAGVAAAATTTIYQVLLESRVDAAAPNEVYLASFATLDDVFSQTIGSPTGFTQLAVSPSFQIADFAATTITTGDVGGSVPEPATWALMLFGFGGLGLAIRRSRHRTALGIA
ncbi:hypothetical protein GCM10022276_15580 [Sphingomonas limnosediminicola]|uniref:Ice-binding protein C-terminal domain-containing protein n=1 Tax=Sphingomonas limnosediminicola TaxID=940133 RepID=A0ABP7LDI8_9SPHN